MTSKLPTSVRLSPEAMALWAALSQQLGIPKVFVIEQALRLLAKRNGVDL